MDKTIIKSSTGSLGPLSIATSLGSYLPITSVTFDTKGMKEVSIDLNFTAQINSPASAASRLIFVIRKTADKGGDQLIGSAYVYANTSTVIEAESFSFHYLDTEVDPGKYTYSIQLDPNSSISGASGVTITNATLTLVAAGCSDKK